MTRKEFMDKFFDLCKDAQEEIPPNVIAEILRDYADRLDQMKKLFAFVLGVLLFCCPFAVQAEDVEPMPQEEIVKAPVLDPITEEQLNDLLGEEMYLGTLDLRGNKVDTKRDYNKKKKKQIGKPYLNRTSVLKNLLLFLYQARASNWVKGCVAFNKLKLDQGTVGEILSSLR